MFLFVIHQLLLEITHVNIWPLTVSEQGMNITQLCGGEKQSWGDEMLSYQRPSPSQLGPKSRAVVNSAPGTGFTGGVTLKSSLKLFCSGSSHHHGACQSNLSAMLKWRGIRDISLTRIYSIHELGCGHSSAGSMMTVRKECMQEKRLVHKQMEVAHRSKI